MENKPKYVKFKNKNIENGGAASNTFHKENVGRVFEVVRESGNMIFITKQQYGFYKDRFDFIEPLKVSLPDELFTI